MLRFVSIDYQQGSDVVALNELILDNAENSIIYEKNLKNSRFKEIFDFFFFRLNFK